MGVSYSTCKYCNKYITTYYIEVDGPIDKDKINQLEKRIGILFTGLHGFKLYNELCSECFKQYNKITIHEINDIKWTMHRKYKEYLITIKYFPEGVPHRDLP